MPKSPPSDDDEYLSTGPPAGFKAQRNAILAISVGLNASVY